MQTTRSYFAAEEVEAGREGSDQPGTHLTAAATGKFDTRDDAPNRKLNLLALYDGSGATIVDLLADGQYRTSVAMYCLAHRLAELLFAASLKPIMFCDDAAATE